MIVISPKLIVHKHDKRLYAYLGYNELGYRFGGNIHVALVLWHWWIFYRLGNQFSESINYFEIPKSN